MRRSDSKRLKNSAAATQTNVVSVGSRNWAFTSSTLRFRPCIFANRLSSDTSDGPPIMDMSEPKMPPRPDCIDMSLPKLFSSVAGSCSKRSVCPVGAVSNTTTSNVSV
jgi:hypothetical protein